jgi:trimeric autotransporter adhesin
LVRLPSTPYGYYFKFTGANPNDATSYVFGSFDNVNANIYTIYSNGTVSARSDAKFKKNIETTRNGYLEDLAQLRVVKYNWYNHDDDTPKELGFIAQEVEQVFPGLVSTVPDKDDQGNETGEVSKSIKTSVFTPMLVKALQEALERIETLEAEVAALKAQ